MELRSLKGGCKIVSHLSMYWMTCMELSIYQRLFDIGAHSYGVHFQFQLDTQLTWLNLRPKSKSNLGKEMIANASVGSAEILYHF